jgi:RNA-directed DNA polymerase
MQTHSLMPMVFEPRFLKIAARLCMGRCSSPGADGVTWKQYRQDLSSRLTGLSHRLRIGEWKPGPLKFAVMKAFNGKEWKVVIPTTEDRIVQRAIRNCIETVLEQCAFHDFVSGYRRRRNRLTSVRQAMGFISQGYHWVADVDVADASSGGEVDEVVEWLARWISDGSLLSLVRKILADLPSPLFLGTGLHPMLLNLRLVPVDEDLSTLRIVRFVDNFCVFCKNEEEARLAFEQICGSLSSHGLRASISKSHIREDVNPEDLFLIAG